jgi:predicted SAM-dependent methyltransferase
MKLNLGCGDNVIQGYLNIDMLPKSANVTRGDIRNLTGIGIQDNSVEEIQAANVLEYLTFSSVGNVLAHWVQKLSKGGSLYIESIDLNVIGTMMAYDQIGIEVINQILYSNNMQGLYNLTAIESHLNSIGCKTEIKGFRDYKFYLRVTKQ